MPYFADRRLAHILEDAVLMTWIEARWVLLAALTFCAGCSGDDSTASESDGSADAGMSDPDGFAPQDSNAEGTVDAPFAHDATDATSGIRPGTCAPPEDIYQPIPKLSLTGCVDPTDP